MPRLDVNPNSKPNSSPLWLIPVLLGFLTGQTHAKDVLSVPEQVSLSANKYTQQLTISWRGGAATTFDIVILRTEFSETAFSETVSVAVDQASGLHQWNWTSVEPLECTSLSIKIRSRDKHMTSEWSNTQILQGNDLPSNGKMQMYPRDGIVLPVGANTTFCCIAEEGRVFDIIRYSDMVMNATQLSRRTFATTVINQSPSGTSGTNVICTDSLNELIGSVVFVGYPPLPVDLACETHDLTSAVCQWNEGRNTYLYGKRRTHYTLNKSSNQKQRQCSLPQWEGNWTLVAVNPLGQYSLTDSAELSHRVRPVAPANLTSVAHAWNATVQWQWKYESYSSLALLCHIELTSHGSKRNYTVSGVGLQSVKVLDLHPDEDYSVRIRCGAQKNFWKWGNWSDPFAFKTKRYMPDAPDVWMWLNRDNTANILWKPLTRWQSHGQLTGYEVTFWSNEDVIQRKKIFSPDTTSAPVNLTQMAAYSRDSKVIATVNAKNADGLSQPAKVVLPRLWTDVEPLAVSRAVYMDSGFFLLWQNNVDVTCGYIVEWNNASCDLNCHVEWLKVAKGYVNVSVESAEFQPGVRYNLSLYSCSSEPPVLLQRWQGYTQELVPSTSVGLSISQQGSDILLTWEEIPLLDRRGFIKGYNIYNSTGSELTLIADWLIMEILISLGVMALFLVIVTFVCYKKRECVIHIVEKPEWDSSKEALVVIPEEDEEEEGMGEEPVDTDEPTSLRYYNQVVDDRPIRPRFPDSSASSASSLDSGRTEVTYTGIQTSGSSLVFQLDPQNSSEGHPPHTDLAFSCGGGGYKPQMQPKVPREALPEPFLEPPAATTGGYKPQNSWHLDSPVETRESGGLAPSLGSPTSVASTQFLLPDDEEHTEDKRQSSSSAATWFTNLLSSTKP
uniref:Leukemia inhibitory factor receptor-like n=1 Tax=Echeneis naucrates TaxID=173247 RepID=A0A665T0M0_ECHNA